MKPLQIAIDGPVGSGKSDISSRLSKELGLVYLNTGAMYRALAWLCQQQGVDVKDELAVMRLLGKHAIDLVPSQEGSKRSFTVMVDHQDVTEFLFTPVNDQPTSDVSTLPGVRKRMVELQQYLAQGKRVVMEGRDIGMRVLPDAQLKIYLTATVEERAKRRVRQWEKRGHIGKTYEDALREIKTRDAQDTGRAVDPLQKLPDAWELNTTGLSKEEVVEKIKQELARRNLL